MAGPGGRANPPLERTLFEEPYRFDFFQAVRLLERMRPEADLVGGEGRPAHEAVRFRSLVSLAFPASELNRLEPAAAAEAGARPPSLTVAFMGLAGPVGVLPEPYTEHLLARRRAGDPTTAAFFDLFNHRMISLFYRAWAKYRPPLAWERGEEDRLAAILFALMGLGTRGLHGRHDFPDAALLFYAGHLAQRHRPAAVLESILRDYFGLPVEIRQFIGRWLALDPADRSTVGAAGSNNGLGTSLMLGARIWDVRSAFRLRVGPVGLERFLALSPDGGDFRALCQMTRLFVDAEFDFDVQLVLKAEEVPDCRLSVAPRAGARLGRTAWLKSRPMERDAEDAVFEGKE